MIPEYDPDFEYENELDDVECTSTFTLKRETPKAYLFVLNDNKEPPTVNECWVPKSQCEYAEDSLTITGWLFENGDDELTQHFG